MYSLIVLLSQLWTGSSRRGQIVGLCPISPNCYRCFSVTQLCLTVSPHGLQQSRLPCPSPFPRVCPSSRLWHQSNHLILWCLLLLLPSIFPSTRQFSNVRMLECCLLESDDQNTGALASASVLPVNIQSWSPLRFTGLISLLSKRILGVFSSTTVRRHQFFGVQGGTIPGMLLSLQADTICRFPSSNPLQCDPKLR